MRLIYRATSLPDAQLVADLLNEAGIDARIFNQNAQSVAGEIPPEVAGPQVWVRHDEQARRARALVDAMQSCAPAGEWQCRACGEANPSNFLTCWCCGGPA